MNSYKTALEAAGAKVHCYEEFGSYQGTIWCKVTFNDKDGWIKIYYGSCSGCDAFEGFTRDLGWDVEPTQDQLAEFGMDYLDEIMSQEEAEECLSKDVTWDHDAESALDYVRSNKVS